MALVILQSELEQAERVIAREHHINYDRADRVWLRMRALNRLRQEHDTMSEPGNSLLTHLRAASEHLKAAEQCAKALGNSAIRGFVQHSLSWLGAAIGAASRMPVIDVPVAEEDES